MALLTHKTTLIRTALVVIYLVALIVLFYTGRTHTVLIDNKDIPGGQALAVKTMFITVGTQKPSEFFKGDRDKFTVKGQKLQLTVDISGTKQSFELPIPLFTDTVLVSVPKLLANITPAMEPFDMYSQSNRPVADDGDDGSPVPSGL